MASIQMCGAHQTISICSIRRYMTGTSAKLLRQIERTNAHQSIHIYVLYVQMENMRHWCNRINVCDLWCPILDHQEFHYFIIIIIIYYRWKKNVNASTFINHFCFAALVEFSYREIAKRKNGSVATLVCALSRRPSKNYYISIFNTKSIKL